MSYIIKNDAKISQKEKDAPDIGFSKNRRNRSLISL